MIDYRITIISVLLALILGFVLGRIKPNIGLYEFFRKCYVNLDNFILLFSFCIVVGSIYFASINKLESFASVVINVFGTVVFSWILTKKSAKVEFKEQEETLALRSYRHINYIESAAKTAYKTIEAYLEDKDNDNLNAETKLMLGRAMDEIKYIQGGINTCKMDWQDMLSEEAKKTCNSGYGDIDSLANKDYGTMQVLRPDTDLNQEDA